jgi:hypothetical protein
VNPETALLGGGRRAQGGSDVRLVVLATRAGLSRVLSRCRCSQLGPE